MSNNLATVLSYYEAIKNRQPDLAAKKLSEKIRIITPLDEKNGKSEVLGAIKGFCTVMEKFDITAAFSQGGEVMLAYDVYFPEPIGKLRSAGLIKLEDDLITNIELFYDGRLLQTKKDDIFS